MHINRESLKRAAVGVGLAGSLYLGANALADDAHPLNENLAFAPDYTKPNDLLSDAFDTLEAGAAYAGAGVLGAQALRQFVIIGNSRKRALSSLGTETITRRRKGKHVLGVGALATGAAIMSGAYFDMADNVNAAQTDVMNSVVGDINPGIVPENLSVLSNSNTPEFLSNPQFPAGVFEELMEEAESRGMKVIPMRWDWETGVGPQTDRRMQIIPASMPQEVTGLPSADYYCESVHVAASSALGADVGDTVDVQGLEVKVDKVLHESAGFNLAPVIFNNEDFAKCLKSNPDQPFSVLLTDAEKAEVDSVLESIGVDNAENIPNRVFVVPYEKFLDNTTETVKGNVNGLILESMLLGLGFAGGALSGRSRTKLEKGSRVNTMLLANGFDKKMLANMYRGQAGEEALLSSAVAAPIIILVDTVSNHLLPGAGMGPNAGTFLGIIGATYIANRLSTEVAVRRQTKELDLSKGHTL